MAYIDIGSGNPIVLLHGNPTSSFIWRNVIPYLSSKGRVLAPDLIGYGQSGKSPSNSYRFIHQADYLESWFEKVLLEEKVILIGQDWGVQLSMDWANRHQDRVIGVAYTEGTIRPRRWEQFPEQTQKLFRTIREEDSLANLLESNTMVNQGLLNGIKGDLSDEEKSAYLAPFKSMNDRLPTIMIARDVPLDGQPEDVAQRVESFSKWMSENEIPKLFLDASEGVSIIGEDRIFARTWHNQSEVRLEGGHFLPEDSPHEMGRAIAKWISGLQE